ncbi:hypothetical protein [Psychrilyobacter sp.]|uniref:hypothetical protein n=1 Tax=Psychrilyobacter sp. TaxID=2586924 RepID=UPI003C752337
MVMLISSTFTINSCKVFANISNYENTGNTPPRPYPTMYPDYFNGFPDIINESNEVIVTAERIILDVRYDFAGRLKDGVMYGRQNHYTGPSRGRVIDFANKKGFLGFLTSEGKFVSEARMLPERKILENELAYSIVFDSSCELVVGSTVTNYGYWKKLVSVNSSSNSSTQLQTTLHYGVTKSELRGIAKTTGSTFSVGFNLGLSGKGASIGASLGYESSKSLTKTFNKQITIENSTDHKLSKTFPSTEFNRRVAIYQYGEKFKPNYTLNEKLTDPLKHFDGLSISVPGESSLLTSTYFGTVVDGTEAPQTNFKDIVEFSKHVRSIIDPSLVYNRAIDLKNTGGSVPNYDTRKNILNVNGNSEFDLVVSLEKSGFYSMTCNVYKNLQTNMQIHITNQSPVLRLGPGSLYNRTFFQFLPVTNSIWLNKGENHIPITVETGSPIKLDKIILMHI